MIELAAALGKLGAETIKRVLRIRRPATTSAAADSLGRIEALAGLKTAWHPVGA